MIMKSKRKTLYYSEKHRKATHFTDSIQSSDYHGFSPKMGYKFRLNNCRTSNVSSLTKKRELAGPELNDV